MKINKITDDKPIEAVIHDAREAGGAFLGIFYDHMRALCALAENLVKLHQNLVQQLVPAESLIQKPLPAVRYALANELVKHFGPGVKGRALFIDIIFQISEECTDSYDISREVESLIWDNSSELLHPATATEPNIVPMPPSQRIVSSSIELNSAR